jgi:hypothetical protein
MSRPADNSPKNHELASCQVEQTTFLATRPESISGLEKPGRDQSGRGYESRQICRHGQRKPARPRRAGGPQPS